jgi:Fe-S-cluster containining protein
MKTAPRRPLARLHGRDWLPPPERLRWPTASGSDARGASGGAPWGAVGAGPGETLKIHIAGLAVSLHDVDGVLADLDATYREFAACGDAYARGPANPHLCYSGCSHCCRRGAFFTLTLAEALRVALAVNELDDSHKARILAESDRAHALQRDLFAGEGEVPDVPGQRDEAAFGARLARVATAGLPCPLLEDDHCAVYPARPLTCRAYGYPVDVFAVEEGSTRVFSSLCSLYEGLVLHDYVRARDLGDRLHELSRRLAGGTEHGQFTSAEAILAGIEYDGRVGEEAL